MTINSKIAKKLQKNWFFFEKNSENLTIQGNYYSVVQVEKHDF